LIVSFPQVRAGSVPPVAASTPLDRDRREFPPGATLSPHVHPDPEEIPMADEPLEPTRRTFLATAGAVAATGALREAAAAGEAQATDPKRLAGEVQIRLRVNGQERSLTVEPRTTLLSALRYRMEPPLTGAKEVCLRGNCGACTVLVDGRPAYSCLQLACTLEGREITTVEGLGTTDDLSPVQEAFCQEDALMCGFCTPGFVVATTACLAKHPDADGETIRAELAGNVCRCGTYPHIFEAAERARDARGGGR
jgi:xanthine dehydrogenase YagT iron-sulfur-binding subunit